METTSDLAQSNYIAKEHNAGFVLFISLVATLGGFLFGFDSGVINGTVDGLQQAFNSQKVATGFNVASMLIGCAVGAFFAGRLSDLFGRRLLLQVSAVLFLVSAWGSGIADSSATFVVYRIIGGIAVGAASVITPAYIAEVAPSHARGRLATLQQVAIISGLFVAFLSNYALANLAGSSTSQLWLDFAAWRWMFWIEIIPAALFLLLLLFIPRSPRFLVMKGYSDEAQSVLKRLYGESEALLKQREINASVAKSKPKLKDVFSAQGKLKPIVWVGIGLATLQQLVGINVVFYYGAVLWQAVGFSEADALLINVVSGGLSILACVLALVLIDKIGRKPLLKWGSIGMTITLGLLVFCFSQASVGEDGKLMLHDNDLLALISANAYVFFFNFSWGPVMWVLLGEMFPNQIRGSALAISGLVQWFANFAVTMTFPLLLTGIGLALTYSIYAGAALLSVFFVIMAVRETKGLELEQMQD